MRDNLPDPGGRPFALPGHRVLALEGRDAAKFAHAQFMSDVAALGDGQWQWSGWLTPKGRVVALFALLRLDAERVWLLLPDFDPGDLAAQLQRFVFRAKVALAVRDDLPVAGAFTAPVVARGNGLAGAPDSGIELDHGGDGGARTLRIGSAPATPADEARVARWKLADLEHGLPRLDATPSAEWTPQMLSLDRLRAFSVKKGCYPGQEIVARTHFLGKGKRELLLLQGDAPFETGGDVVSVASDGARHLALAVRAIEREPDARETALLGGLAR